MSFAHHICCCFVIYNLINYSVEQKSQLASFLVTWKILIVDYCVK